tara:strand:+ start:1227 stop:1874 length:648 start_codon:yes stop_codon:yes gene_type:complete
MENRSLPKIRADLKAKRDTLGLAHEDLKISCDYYNKLIIFISLASSLFESAKLTLGWEQQSITLLPIFLSSIVAGISSFIKFKNYSERQEILIQASVILTATLGRARNANEVDESLLQEYHTALELLETSLYPDVRKKFLKQSQKNLVSIIESEQKYFDVVNTAKKGLQIKDVVADMNIESSTDDSSTDDIISKPIKSSDLEEDIEEGLSEEKQE